MDWDNMDDRVNSFIAYNFINDKVLNNDDLIITTSDNDEDDEE